MAKKNPAKYGKKLRKDPGIPNLYPFKAQLLQRVSGAVFHPLGAACLSARTLAPHSKSAPWRA